MDTDTNNLFEYGSIHSFDGCISVINYNNMPEPEEVLSYNRRSTIELTPGLKHKGVSFFTVVSRLNGNGAFSCLNVAVPYARWFAGNVAVKHVV